MTSVRRAGADDLLAVAGAFGEGALDEAVYSWVIPDEAERRKRLADSAAELTGWLGTILESGEIWVAGQESGKIAGVALWQFVDPAQPAKLDDPEVAAAFFERTYGPYALRMLQLLELIEKSHPRSTAHIYLMTIVVAPEWRSRGLGGAMLRQRLAAADADGQPAYLEASTPRNRELYLRHGFRDLGDPVELPDDGPRLQPMWRDPVAS